MEFPNLSPGQYAVLQAEVDTGIVLTVEGNRYLGSGEAFFLFDSLQSAREFALNKVAASPGIECHIYSDSSGNKEIETFRNRKYQANKP